MVIKCDTDIYLRVNTEYIREYGANAAVFIAAILEEYRIVRPEFGGYIPITIKQIEDLTGLTAYQQRNIIEKLNGVIDVKVFGAPPRRYIRIN